MSKFHFFWQKGIELTVNRYFIKHIQLIVEDVLTRTSPYINWQQKHRVNVSLDVMIKGSRALQKMNNATVGADSRVSILLNNFRADGPWALQCLLKSGIGKYAVVDLLSDHVPDYESHWRGAWTGGAAL
jgi:hypothetical protein